MAKEFTGAKLFLNIPINIARDKDLLKKPKSILLMGEIISMLNVTGDFYMSNQELAKRLDCTPRAIQKYLTLLENKGYIGRKNIYDDKDSKKLIGRKVYLGSTPMNAGSPPPRTGIHGGHEQAFTTPTNAGSPKENNIKEQLIEQKNKGTEDKPPVHPPYKEIISYLNEKTGKKYKYASKSNQSLINARYREGYKLEDFKKVIDNKTLDWVNSTKMSQFLRPRTLFGTKFEDYLNEDVKSNGSKPTYDFTQEEWQANATDNFADDLPF